MKQTSSKMIHLFLVFMLFTQYSYAASENFTSLVKDYQYALTVEWDQKDQEFLKHTEGQFKEGVVKLLNDGASPQDLMKESLLMISDESLRQELAEGIRLYQNGKLTENELLNFITQNTSSMGAQGSSWSPAVKIILGVIGGYVIFKLLLITIMYWDTDPNYGQGTQPPIKN